MKLRVSENCRIIACIYTIQDFGFNTCFIVIAEIKLTFQGYDYIRIREVVI
jgi:hypothetical protein